MTRALHAIAARHDGQEVVVVSHGDPIKAAVCRLTGTAMAEVHALRVYTGALVAIEMGSDGARIVERWEPARMAKR